MFVPLPSLTDKKGERMNGVMNHRKGGGLQTMIMRPRDHNLTPNNGVIIRSETPIISLPDVIWK